MTLTIEVDIEDVEETLERCAAAADKIGPMFDGMPNGEILHTLSMIAATFLASSPNRQVLYYNAHQFSIEVWDRAESIFGDTHGEASEPTKN